MTYERFLKLHDNVSTILYRNNFERLNKIGAYSPSQIPDLAKPTDREIADYMRLLFAADVVAEDVENYADRIGAAS